MSSALIVDDHPVVRAAVRIVLLAERFTTIYEASTGEQAMSLIREHRPRLVVLDLNLMGKSGLEFIPRIKADYPDCLILVFTSYPPEHCQERCIRAGARAYVAKNNSLEQLYKAIQAVKSGHCYFSALPDNTHSLSSAQVTEKHLLKQLSDREITIFVHLAEGKANKTIAARLNLSHKTVSTYKTRLMAKLGLKSLMMVREFAKRNGLIREV